MGFERVGNVVLSFECDRCHHITTEVFSSRDWDMRFWVDLNQFSTEPLVDVVCSKCGHSGNLNIY